MSRRSWAGRDLLQEYRDEERAWRKRKKSSPAPLTGGAAGPILSSEETNMKTSTKTPTLPATLTALDGTVYSSAGYPYIAPVVLSPGRFCSCGEDFDEIAACAEWTPNSALDIDNMLRCADCGHVEACHTGGAL